MDKQTTLGRRTFLATGAGAISSMTVNAQARGKTRKRRPDPEHIRVGIVGRGPYAHTSYVYFLLGLRGHRLYQTHMHITHIWGDDYKSSYKGKIRESGYVEKWLARTSPEYFAQETDMVVVKHPEDMIGKVDGAIIMDFDKSAHLAEPFLSEGIPIFVNRPYAATMSDGRKILDMAEATGTASSRLS